MPPFKKGIDRELSAGAVGALWEIGHRQVVAIVDPSYPVPPGAWQVEHKGNSSARALKGILDIVPHDTWRPTPGDADVALMRADKDKDKEKPTARATKAFVKVLEELGLGWVLIPAEDEGTGVNAGFYTLMKRAETLYVKTSDERAFACAAFMVGHSQKK